MKLCNENCIAFCDFCIYFSLLTEGPQRGSGWCSIHKRTTEPHDMCDDFYCHIAYREENWQ